MRIMAGMEQPPVLDVWHDGGASPVRRLALDLVLGGAFVLVFGLVQAATSTTTVWATVLLGLALAVRRISVPLLLVAAIGSAVLQVATGEVAAVADVAYVPLAFTLGTHPTALVRRVGLACVVVAVAVAGASTAIAGNSQFDPSGSSGVGIGALTLAVLGGGWTAGYLRWQRRQSVQDRVDAVVTAAERDRLAGLVRHEQERNRIAADMHDLVAHSWAVVAAQADGARYVLREDPARAEEALRVIGDTARSSMTDVRSLLAELRDGAAGDHPDAPDAASVIDRMRRTGLVIAHEQLGFPDDGPLAEAAGFVLTESLTNALKHGDRQQPVEVEEDWREGYRLRVRNRVPATPGVRGAGHGLRGMTERVTATGGRFEARDEGEHWVVEVLIPAGTGR